MPSNSAGGVFLPNDPPPATNMVLTTPAITGGTITSATIASGTFSAGSTFAYQTVAATSAGTTGTDATAISIGAPGLVTVTGASGAGVGLGVGTAGQMFQIRNINATGVQNVYSVGGTINGTTGTTAVGLSPTGTKAAIFSCVTAGAWQIMGITTT